MNSNSKRIAKNTMMLYARMGILLFVNLFASRVLLEKLGVEDFGIYNVIGGVASMFTFFTSSLANATQRFLNIELGRNNLEGAKYVFQQHLTLYMAILVGVIVVAEPIGLWLIYHKLVIPADKIVAAVWIFQFTLVSLCASLVGIVFNSVLVSHENMSVYAWLSIFEGIAKLLICYIISIAASNRLIFYGLLLMTTNLVVQAAYMIYCFKKYEECKLGVRWDKKLLRETSGIVGWNTVGTAVWMINDNFMNILLNMFFGPVVNAARAISYQVNAALGNFTSNFFTAVRPQLMKSYAQKDFSNVKTLLYNSTRYSIFLFLVLALPVVFCIDSLLALWLKNVPENTALFSILVIAITFVSVPKSPLWDIVLATGKLRKYQMVGCTILLFAFPVSYVLLRMGYPAVSVFYVLLVVRFLHYIASVIIVSPMVECSLIEYWGSIYKPVLRVMPLAIVLHVFLKMIFPIGALWTFCYIALSLMLNLCLIYVLGISSKEKQYVLSFIKLKLNHEKSYGENG